MLKHFEGVDPKKIAFIGDRILTDVLFANYNGFFSILVDPIDPNLEKINVKLVRIFERLLI
jgi:predicted HAD superfamily phosphohydrolase YqeG